LQSERDKTKNIVSRYDGRIANIIKNNEIKVNELESQIKTLESRPIEATYTSLDDCFETSSIVGEGKFENFYETLHHNVLSSIYDCTSFITDDSLPIDARRYARERFKTIGDELENQLMLIEEDN